MRTFLWRLRWTLPILLFSITVSYAQTDAQKAQIAEEMAASVAEHTGLSPETVHAFTTDTPASWVMEGGDILPEPGEEEAWLAAHEAKLAAQEASA